MKEKYDLWRHESTPASGVDSDESTIAALKSHSQQILRNSDGEWLTFAQYGQRSGQRDQEDRAHGLLLATPSQTEALKGEDASGPSPSSWENVLMALWGLDSRSNLTYDAWHRCARA